MDANGQIATLRCMRIVFAGPQLGAVSDLAVALQRLGHEVAALLPFDDAAAGRTRPTRVQIPIAVGSKRIVGEILQASGPEKLPCYLVRAIEPLPPKSAARGIFHSQLVVEMARRLIPSPDILHLSGWETALAPAYLRQSNLPFRTVLDLREVENQGSFDGTDFALTNLAAGFFSPGGVEFFGRLNILKAGLLLANAFTVNARSTLAAWQVEPAGHGLSGVLKEQAHKCAPIFSPDDADAWDPATDSLIAKTYSADDPDGKMDCRAALLASAGFARNARGPILIIQREASALGDGPDSSILDRWIASEGRIVVLTTRAVESAGLESIARREAANVFIARRPDEAVLRCAVAGADYQWFSEAPTADFATAAWRAMRYGTIPLVRDHPGRSDVFADSTETDRGEGLAWFVDSIAARWDTLGHRAMEIFRDSDRLAALRLRAMKRAANVTMTSVAEAHLALYRRLGIE